MNPLANAAKSAGNFSAPDHASDIVEVCLLLSVQQISDLAQQAQRRGLTSAQFLRQYISSLCQGMTEAA